MERSFSSGRLRSLLAFGSHQPFDGDSAADVERVPATPRPRS